MQKITQVHIYDFWSWKHDEDDVEDDHDDELIIFPKGKGKAGQIGFGYPGMR